MKAYGGRTSVAPLIIRIKWKSVVDFPSRRFAHGKKTPHPLNRRLYGSEDVLEKTILTETNPIPFRDWQLYADWHVRALSSSKQMR
jgi:hypothetical protein